MVPKNESSADDTVIDMLRRGDKVGVKVRAEKSERRLWDETLQFCEAHRHQQWWADRPKDDRYSSWEPRVKPILDTLSPAMDAYIADAVAAGYHDLDCFEHFTPPLPKLFRFAPPGDGLGTIRQVPQFVATLIGNSLLVAALMRESWTMFAKTAVLKDRDEGIPWTMTGSFNALPFLNYRFDLTASAVEGWVTMSSALRDLRKPADNLVALTAQANILIFAGAHARGYEWTRSRCPELYRIGNDLESFVRLVAHDDRAAKELAPVVVPDGREAGLRAQLYGVIEDAAKSGHLDLSDKTLELLRPPTIRIPDMPKKEKWDF